MGRGCGDALAFGDKLYTFEVTMASTMHTRVPGPCVTCRGNARVVRDRCVAPMRGTCDRFGLGPAVVVTRIASSKASSKADGSCVASASAAKRPRKSIGRAERVPEYDQLPTTQNLPTDTADKAITETEGTAHTSTYTANTSTRPQLSKLVPLATRVALCAVAFALTNAATPDAAVAKAAAVTSQSGGFIASAMDFALNLDERLLTLFTTKAEVAYGVLFAVIFCETGLVVAPFLPGDSLLFAAGALGAGGVLSFPFACLLLFTAAVLGDTVNYGLGSLIGAKVIAKFPRVFKPSYIEKTKKFYETHGGKTVVLARFFVVVRTFAPFIAGVANMQYRKFLFFNLVGAASWVGSFMTLGYFFGQLPWVEQNFALAMAAVVALSAVPMFVELAKHVLAPKEAVDEAAVTEALGEIGRSIDDEPGFGEGEVSAAR